MSDQPQDWMAIFDKIPPWAGGVIMALVVSVLRIIYDREETSAVRMVSEAMICGALTLAIGSGVEAAGLGNGWHLFIGGLVGALGSQFVRTIAKSIISKKVDK